MKLIKYIILGIIQGFTEPLPISSSGHVFIIKNLLKLNETNGLNFEIVVNFGSLVAVLLIYRKKIFSLIKSFILYFKTRNNNYKNDFYYITYIIIGSIPVCIFGFLFKNIIENVISLNYSIIGISFLITSIFLFLVRNKDNNRNNINLSDALYIGIIQVIALLPGISRSGCTLVAGLFSGLNRKSAFDYSFMLYIPVSIGTTILGLKDLNTQLFSFPYILGFLFSLIVSYFTMRWFRNLVTHGKLIYFSIYCLIMGLFILLFM